MKAGGKEFAYHLSSRWFIARLAWPWKRRRHVPPQRRIIFVTLHTRRHISVIHLSIFCLHKERIFFLGEGWSEIESTITEATTGLMYQRRNMMHDDGCGAIGGMLATEIEVLEKTCPSVAFPTINPNPGHRCGKPAATCLATAGPYLLIYFLT
jgi:hypothetical protein